MDSHSDRSTIVDEGNNHYHPTGAAEVSAGAAAAAAAVAPVLIPIRVPNANDEYDAKQQQQQQQYHQLNEWAMIEINGELILPSSVISSSSSSSSAADDDNDEGTKISATTLFDTHNRIELGSITFEGNDTSSSSNRNSNSNSNSTSTLGTPILIIGTHELRGTIQELTQPFLCLQKCTSIQSTDASASQASSSESTIITNVDTTTNMNTEYHIQGIIKYKLIFNQYPKTILR
jgi:Ctf8